MVGSGAEDPSVIAELLDVQKHPRKPQYRMASEGPLLLNSTGFADLGDLHLSPWAAIQVRGKLEQLISDQEVRLGMLYTVSDAVESVAARQESSVRVDACKQSDLRTTEAVATYSAHERTSHGPAQRDCDAGALPAVEPGPMTQQQQSTACSGQDAHSIDPSFGIRAACPEAAGHMHAERSTAPEAQCRQSEDCSGPGALKRHKPGQPISKKLRNALGPRVLGRPHIKLLQRATELSFSERLAALKARNGVPKPSGGLNFEEEDE
jgi:hypothetical protein